MATAAAIASPGQAAFAPANVERVDPLRVLAFLAMCFGMFMAFLDIQVVSASLSEIQAGLAASSDEITWVQTSYLMAEVVAIPLSGFLSRALGTRAMFATAAARLHRRQPDVRAVVVDGPDDRLARDPGLHRRRHGADGLRLRLFHLPAPASADHYADDRAGCHAGADHRSDGRRLFDRYGVVALAVLHQHRARHRGDDRSHYAHRFRQAGLLAVPAIRHGRPHLHGAVSGHPRIRPGRGPALRLVRGFHDRLCRHGIGDVGRDLLRPRAHGATADRRSFRLCRPQFRARQHVLVRTRHRPLRPHLPLSDLSQPDPRLQRADDRPDPVRIRRRQCS